jgi:hypothetical protein
MHPRFKVYIVNSDDLSRVEDVSKQCFNKSFQLALNRPGSFSWEMPLDTDVIDDLHPVKNGIMVKKDNSTIWSGQIWNKRLSLSGDRISLGAVGWDTIFQKRIINDETLTFETEKRGAIILGLLTHTNTYHPTWITPGTNTDTATVDVTRSYEFLSKINTHIEQLCDEESGPYYLLDYDTREMNLYAWDDYEVKDDVIIAYRKIPKTASQFEVDINADTMVNHLHVVGQSVGGFADDTDSQDFFGQKFQDVLTISDTNDANLLGAIANAEIAVNSYPRTLYEVLPKTESNDVPEFFTDYGIGNAIYVSGQRHDINIPKTQARVFSANVSIDSNENTKVTSLGIING